MGTAKGAIRLGCIVVAVWVISQVVIGLTAPFWLAPRVGVFGTAVGATPEQIVDWTVGCGGCLACLVPNLTILWFLVGPVNVELRRSRKPTAPQGDTLTSIAMKGWKDRDESVEDTG